MPSFVSFFSLFFFTYRFCFYFRKKKQSSSGLSVMVKKKMWCTAVVTSFFFCFFVFKLRWHPITKFNSPSHEDSFVLFWKRLITGRVIFRFPQFRNRWWKKKSETIRKLALFFSTKMIYVTPARRFQLPLSCDRVSNVLQLYILQCYYRKS